MRGGRGRGYGGMAPGGQRPRNPQNNIPRQLQPSQSHGGQMATNHLQGLKDIDMELELLKRKREIIEQQQQMLSNTYRQRDDYEQPMYNEARENRYDDYTRLYDNPREPDFNRGGHNEGRGGRNDSRGGRNDGRGGRNDGRGGRNEGARKRPHIPVWEAEVPSLPKRFSAPSRGKNPPSPRFSSAPNRARPDSRPQPSQSRPQPLFPDIRPARRPPARKREFKPTKVSKPTSAPPMKLASYQPAVRRKLVTDAVASGAVSDDSLILRADREPTHLMVGRLELTLGAIMKDVKNANPNHENLFKAPQVLRAMKQCVRDRIRTAMIGKTVSNTDHIKTAYYEMFPLGSDDDVIKRGLMAYQNKTFIAVDTANPEMYFKKNIRSLMILKMEEMMNKLSEIYTRGGTVAKRTQSRYKGPYKPRPAKGKPSVAPKEDTSVKESAQGDAKPKADETQVVDVEPENEPESTNEAAAENKTVDDHNETKDDAVVETEEKAEPVQEEENINEISAENQPIDEIKPEAETQTIAETQPKPDSVIITHNKGDPFVVPKEMINNETYKALDNLLTYKMMHLIKKFAPDLVQVMDLDAMYRKNKAAIIAETAKKMKKPISATQAASLASTITSGQDQPGTDVGQNVPVKNSPANPRPPMYFVKILGKPSLPKRKAMEYFFNQFKPKTIKKHKNVHNLLFVGFLDKEAYDNILAADGTAIGRHTLDIKVSERNDPNKARNDDTLPTKSETDKLNESTDSFIGGDLDSQITNLLSSIKSNDDESFSEDIIMTEPPVSDVNDTKSENQEQTKMDEVIDCDADQNANNVANDDDDVIEFNDAIENADNENHETSRGGDETYDPAENFDDTNDEPQNIDGTNDEPQNIDGTNDEPQNIDETNVTPKTDVIEIQDGADNDDVVEIKDVQQNNDVVEEEKAEETDAVGIKSDPKNVKATPTRARASARLATPATRTRRAVNRTE